MKKTMILLMAAILLTGVCSFASAQEGNMVIFEGKKTAQGKDAMLDFYFTEHVGGAFDATAMTKGSKLVLEYEGPEKDGIYLALISHSGGNRWLTLNPNKVTLLENGRCQAEFYYISISMKIGGLFNLLDEIRPLCAGGEKVTLYKVEYVEGDGEPVKYGPSDWLKPSEGIAFLGDSITQNVFYNEGDFNTKVAAGNHNAVGNLAYIVDVVNARSVLNLCYYVDIFAAIFVKEGTESVNVALCGNEGRGNKIYIVFNTEEKVGLILLGEVVLHKHLSGEMHTLSI